MMRVDKLPGIYYVTYMLVIGEFRPGINELNSQELQSVCTRYVGHVSQRS
jgi:hypothetical protein